MKIDIFFVLVHWLVLFLFAPLFIGVITRVKAIFAGRVGPSVLQLYYDLSRLLNKKCVYSHAATWVFRAAPVVAFAMILAVSLIVPFGPFLAPVQFSGDIFLIVYLLALARFFMIIAAWDTGSSFEGLGAAREAFFSCFAELALFMNFITLAVSARSFSLSQMIGANVFVLWKLLGPAFLLVIASFFIVLLAENCRIPVDDPDTHLELTMIHEVMILDNSGVDLAYMLYTGAAKFFIFAGILVPILFPFRTGDFFADSGIFFLSMLVISTVVGLVESGMARLRFGRIRGLLLMAFALAFFGFIVALWRA